MRTIDSPSCEHAARERKAQRLADALTMLHCDSETAGWLTDEAWERLAMFAEVRPPSSTTRNMVVDLLREREDRARRFSAMMSRLPGVGA